MKKKVILKNTSFGFHNTAELFEKMVTPKFVKLKETELIDDYYNFVLSAGVVRDWLRNEFNIEKEDAKKIFDHDKMYSVFHSIYNNSKHFHLTDAGDFYVILDGKTTSISEEGNSVITLDTPVTLDTHIFINTNISGETGKLYYFCTIKNKETGEEEHWFIYEICKYVYEKLEGLIYKYTMNKK